jgi:hypothetical protein
MAMGGCLCLRPTDARSPSVCSVVRGLEMLQVPAASLYTAPKPKPKGPAGQVRVACEYTLYAMQEIHRYIDASYCFYCSLAISYR